MAELEYKGIKIGGSKLLLIVPAFSAVIGGAYGGFEVYQRYLSMEEKIANFVSPDLSHIEKHMVMVEGELAVIGTEFDSLKDADGLMNEVIREQVTSVKDTVANLQNNLQDMRMELKTDMASISDILDAQEDRLKEDVRSAEEMVDSVEREVSLDLKVIQDLMKEQEARNRDNVEDVRGIINSFEIRMDTKLSLIHI